MFFSLHLCTRCDVQCEELEHWDLRASKYSSPSSGMAEFQDQLKPYEDRALKAEVRRIKVDYAVHI